MKTRQNPNTAFTLVELLFVVALIGVLALLIVGVTGRVSANGRNIKCVANLRATGAAALSYFTDRNGLLFESKTWYCYPSWGPNGWVGMRDYLGIDSTNLDNASPEFHHDSIITCPEIKRLHVKAFPTFLNMGFGMNFFLNVNDPAPFYSWPNRPRLAGAPGRINAVPKLSAMWMFSDIAGHRVERGGSFFSDIGPNSETYMYFPHQGKQNVIFMDGHIESLTEEQWRSPSSQREFWGNLAASD